MTDGLTGESSMLNLPTEPRPYLAPDTPRVGREQGVLDVALVQQIREIAPAAPAAGVLAAFQVLLYRLSGRTDFSLTVRVCDPAVPNAPMGGSARGGPFPVVCHTRAGQHFGELVSSATSAIATIRPIAAPTLTSRADDANLPLCFDAGDWRLFVIPLAAQISVLCEYDAELFDPGAGSRWLDALEGVLRAGLAEPDREISTLPWPDADVCVHTLIDRHARRAPGDAAVVFGDEVIGYGALDRQAAAVRGALIASGVVPGSVVAVYLSRSLDLVTAILGIMKAGGAWVSLDPADPQARVTAILDHSRAVAIVTDTARRRQLPASSLPLVCVDDVSGATRADAGAGVPPSLDAPACHIYACEARELRSMPMSHRALTRLLSGVRRELCLTHEDVGLALSPPSLDVSLVELLAPLSGTGCVVIADDDVALDAERLTEAIRRFAPTIMMAPTSVWADLLGAGGATWARLKAVSFGAMLDRSISTELWARTSAAWFAGASAPAAIWTTLHRLTERDSGEVLGRPLPHVSLRIVDDDEHDAAPGVTGELLVRIADGGASSWSTTRQRARWRADGAVELVAPRPREAYIDGFRIDLDDVADVIRRHHAIVDADVELDVTSSPERLVACVVPAEGAGYNVSELRRELRRTVPAAMVPRSFVEVGSIPRSADGRALPRGPLR